MGSNLGMEVGYPDLEFWLFFPTHNPDSWKTSLNQESIQIKEYKGHEGKEPRILDSGTR
jgi:hypothetical protein